RLEADPVFADGPQLDGRHLPQQGTEVSLELSVGLWMGLHVTRPRFQPASAEPPQGAPARLTTDLASEPRGQPLCDGPPAPAVALRMGSCHGRCQLRELGGW